MTLRLGHVRKTKAMTCMPGYIRGQVSTTAYRRRLEGVGETYRERQRRRVECSICGTNLASSSLSLHYMTIHGMAPPSDVGRADAPGRQPASYRVSFPRIFKRVACTVEGCPGTATSWAHLRRHFASRHFHDNLVILEEGSLPRCKRCGMYITRSSYSRHLRSALCRKGEARNRQRVAAEDAARAREVVFTVKWVQLEQVDTFRYLGRPLTSTDDDWPAIYSNLSMARKRWGMLSRLLRHERATPRASATLYQAVVQSALLYGSETWDVSDKVFQTLSGFHHRVVRRISGRPAHYLRLTGEWVYPPIAEAFAATGLVETLVAARQRRLVEIIAARPILQLCEGG